MDNGGDKNRIANYQRLIATYENYKLALDTQLAQVQQSDSNQRAIVSAMEVTELVRRLYELPLSGKTIQNFYAAQQNIVRYEILENTERTIRPRIEPNKKKNSWSRRLLSLW